MQAVVEFFDGATRRFEGVSEYTVAGGILMLRIGKEMYSDPILIPFQAVRVVYPMNVTEDKKSGPMGFTPTAVTGETNCVSGKGVSVNA